MKSNLTQNSGKIPSFSLENPVKTISLKPTSSSTFPMSSLTLLMYNMQNCKAQAQTREKGTI